MGAVIQRRPIGSAFAYVIDATNYNTALGFATVTSSPRGMDTKSIGSYTGIGVMGGFVDAEIDLNGPEHIYVNYTVANHIDYIDVGFLFTEGNYGDVVSEIARIVASVSPWIAGDLTATSALAGTWASSTPGGTASNISPGNDLGTNAGVWRILNPFGDYFTKLVGLLCRSKRRSRRICGELGLCHHPNCKYPSSRTHFDAAFRRRACRGWWLREEKIERLIFDSACIVHGPVLFSGRPFL